MSIESSDEFAPDSLLRRTYSLDQIVTETGDLGPAKVIRNYESRNLRMPSYLKIQIDRLVAEIPEYNSAADFERDAIYHRVEYWRQRQQLSAETDLKLREYQSFAELRSFIAENEYYRELLAEVSRGLQSCQDPAERQLLLSNAQNAALNTFNELWAKRFRELIRTYS